MAVKKVVKIQPHCGINLKFCLKSPDFILRLKLNSIKMIGNSLNVTLLCEYFYTFLF